MAAPSPYGPPAWSDAEKNFLLAELIKQAAPSPTQLFNVWFSLNRPQIGWADVSLPHRRTLNECKQAFESIRQRAGTQPPMSMNMPSGLGPQTPSPLSAPGALKRGFPFEVPAGRAIQPKPSSTGHMYGQPAPLEQHPRKKRGRPTKAEAAARAEAQGMAGEPSSATRLPAGGFPPFSPAATAPEALDPAMTASGPAAEEMRQTAPPVSRMPISSIITPTAPTTTSQSSSSSGKRRRGRSTRSEPESFPVAGTLGARQTETREYESPYAVAAADPSPARAAVMRHREELPPSGPGQSMTATPATTQSPAGSAPEHTRST
ncbi:uncharacterized protein LTR77_002879 [Saxophila tyrrhenica]|uniref:Myb-like domain-containing protein n=1 Tax=Saxophila tyrrhenica TaxID=1690608 RepID=A0AAV9PIL8_9PEZI|nr:hypothetical protein LTR77_002879 [Saxophila tyrrhenica]